ncbi:TPA: hypothetical protein ACGT0B_004346 [Enterobacter hormaechei]|uniref:hypothetical protein n=1 Tax=Enterobacter hormaechei TaxID=158836 RepID=UPI002861851E|nr:hypothetical protein [Enterobacter hormaechei]ELD3315885.1 hypothetical protein [Enterobacter hormaechei]ELD3473286.1 hypothetical protein [Enterobacter hormaechei]ELD3486543.1 hypothetical protein [Enterobacter hormaechei]MDR9955888.1 hypothetical protein [Enterobacter hormaechei subsp. xiangfangensis]MDS0074266.1 hypothetical protein [Enterobacter hormaechei subsp. xiangfangensis]
MAVLLDNDVVLKLAQLDLLADGCKLLTSKYGQLYVLDTLIYQLRGKSAVRRYGADAIARVQSCLGQGSFLLFGEVITDPRLISLQNNFDNLDEGEMRLVQGLLNHHDLLLSGDKRFLKAIADTGFIEEAALNNRFVCLEQVICFLINELSLAHVNEKAAIAFQGEFRVDSALRTCIGYGRTHEHVIEGFLHQLRELPDILLSIEQHWQISRP